jgi:hypothetical protein
MDISRDNGLVVDRAYEDKAPYVLTGTGRKVVFARDPTTAGDELALHEQAAAQALGGGTAGLDPGSSLFTRTSRATDNRGRQ